MRSFFHKWAFALIYLTLMAACSPAPILTPTLTPSPMPVRTGALTPYTLPAPAEPTPSRTPDAATPLPVPSITPTPLTYTVRASDDMGGIAYRFGVTVADLIAANPKVNPRAMSVGTVLIIPATGHAPAAAATAEAAPSPSQHNAAGDETRRSQIVNASGARKPRARSAASSAECAATVTTCSSRSLKAEVVARNSSAFWQLLLPS